MKGLVRVCGARAEKARPRMDKWPYFGHDLSASKRGSPGKGRFMKRIGVLPVGKRALMVRLAIVAPVCLAAAPLAAGPCARGQIYQVSKKTCIDKADAAKLGIYHGRVDSPKPAPDAAADDAPQDTAADSAPAAPDPAPAAQQNAEAPVAPPAQPAPAPSPYGALSLESFAKRQ
jgi:hypothetical protein